jgi:GH15 family glucan-1,4-alpha-glucosidase
VTAAIEIADHGLIGDTRTAALVTSDGTIDWMCVPRFDGEPVFGCLVGGDEAGRFRAGPADDAHARVTRRRYLEATATIETTWTTAADAGTDGGELVLTEGMVAELGNRLLPTTLLVRRLEARRASVRARIDFDPRLGDLHRRPRHRRGRHGLVCTWRGLAVALGTSPLVDIEPGVPLDVVVDPGRPLVLTVAVAHREPLVHVDADEAWAALQHDEARWRRWCDGVDGDLPHRDAVVRSLMTLRLLTYSPSGAPVAAPTTSLPEDPGGIRNWDYRFAGPRDASIGIGAFLGAGKVDEARHFFAWLLHASRLDRPRMPVLLTLDGRHPRAERELVGWPGYEQSRPVRAGNGAADQHQLDGYGWVLDAAWLLTRAGEPLNSEAWRAMRGFADEVASRWTEPDSGIWEVRGDLAHHVHSKLMAWLALDRALRIAATRRTPARQITRWTAARSAVADEVTSRGYDAGRGAYTRTYGSRDLDAAVLILPLLDLEPRGSPRVDGTIDAIREELGAGGPLVFRYPPGTDGLPGTEGAFLPCTFWLVQALATSGRREEAGALFADALALANPLGLLPEEIDPASGAHLGNFPQALSHAALVQAALSLQSGR